MVTRRELSEVDAGDDPFALFDAWYREAQGAQPMADGMVLGTATPDGRPSSRVVLLKAYGADGFVFYTNYESRKGVELEANPRASLLFWWPAVERQVRIEGQVARVSDEESDAYFASRPRASNLSAMASAQSRPARSRDELEERVAALADAWRDQDLARPGGWGGYRVAPDVFEFWQGRSDRLHDRLIYRRVGPAWQRGRLWP